MAEDPRDPARDMSEFRARFGLIPGKTTSADYYRWKKERNPAGAGSLELVMRGDDVAGSASLTPRRLIVRGAPVPGAEIGDTYTSPDYRRQGIFSEAVNRCVSRVRAGEDMLVYGTPNDASLPGYVAKLNFAKLEREVLVMSKHLSTASAARSLTRRLRSGLLAGVAALGYALAQKLVRTLASPGAVRRLRAGEVPATIDSGWGDRTGFDFFGERSDSYLRWRFVANPDAYEFLVAERDGECTGYAVLKTVDADEARRGMICDLVARDDEAGTIRSLLAGSEAELIEQGADTIEVWFGDGTAYAEIAEAALYRKVGRKPVIVFRESGAADLMLREEGRWHFTMSDSDNV